MSDTKRCPYCGGEIKAVAKKCKYCGKWLTESPRPVEQPVVDIPEQQANTRKETPAVNYTETAHAQENGNSNKWLKPTIICTAAVVMGLILFFATKSHNDSSQITGAPETENTHKVVSLETWEDSVAYAIGLNYALEVKSGYRVPISQYAKKQYLEYFGSENPPYSFEQLCNIGYENGKISPQEYYSGYAQTLLNLLNCESSILKSEDKLSTETDAAAKERITEGIYDQYRRMEFILRNHPEVSFTSNRIINFTEKRNEALIHNAQANSKPDETASPTPKIDLGNWSKEGNSLISSKFKSEYEPVTVQIILEKGKVVFRFNTNIEKEYEMKLLKNGGSEITLSGKLSGKDFIMTNSRDIDNVKTYLRHGSCSIQYMFLEPGASHWGWYDFTIGDKLSNVEQAYQTL